MGRHGQNAVPAHSFVRPVGEELIIGPAKSVRRHRHFSPEGMALSTMPLERDQNDLRQAMGPSLHAITSASILPLNW